MKIEQPTTETQLRRHLGTKRENGGHGVSWIETRVIGANFNFATLRAIHSKQHLLAYDRLFHEHVVSLGEEDEK